MNQNIAKALKNNYLEHIMYKKADRSFLKNEINVKTAKKKNSYKL